MSAARSLRLSLAVVTSIAIAACSLANRTGPDATCKSLRDSGAVNDCADGIIASCTDGAHMSYEVCHCADCNSESDLCAASWQPQGQYRCAKGGKLQCPPWLTACPDSCYGEGPTCLGYGTVLDRCLDTQGDPQNCGACGLVCVSGECVKGRCDCSSVGEGFIQCDGSCVDPMSSSHDCGGCGKECPNGCMNGSCVP